MTINKYQLDPKPNFKLIGHRGVAGLRPENTYASFKHASELGLNWIEFDVQLSKSDEWFIMHDKTLNRTTNGSGPIRQHISEEIRKLEAGLWFAPPYPNQPIPTLLETLELTRKTGLQSNIEVKGCEKNPSEYAESLAILISDNCHRNFPLPLISSFNLNFLKILKNLLPDLPIGYLVDKFSKCTVSRAIQYKFATINCDAKTITNEDLQLAIQSQIPVMLYTINDPQLAKYWLQQGVSAIFTDRPDLLLQQLN